MLAHTQVFIHKRKEGRKRLLSQNQDLDLANPELIPRSKPKAMLNLEVANKILPLWTLVYLILTHRKYLCNK